MDPILELVFQTCQYDLIFVSKFRELSKSHKLYSEKWLQEISNPEYLRYIDVSVFKNLRKLTCGDIVTDRQLQELKYITHINFSGWDCKITDEGIKHMNLYILNAYYNPNITNEGIKHMKNCKLYK